MLERTLEEDVARRKSKSESSSTLFKNDPLPGQEEAHSSEEDEDDIKGIMPSALCVGRCCLL